MLDNLNLSQEPSPSPTSNDNLSSDKKPCPWLSAVDPETGRTYYYHKNKHQASWDKPKGFEDTAEEHLTPQPHKARQSKNKSNGGGDTKDAAPQDKTDSTWSDSEHLRKIRSHHQQSSVLHQCDNIENSTKYGAAKNEEEAEVIPVNNAKDGATNNEEEAEVPPMNKPSKSATTQAFVATLQVMAACVGVFLAVISIPDFFAMQQTFWTDLSNNFIYVAKKHNCTEIYECIPEAGVWCVANCPAIQEDYVSIIAWAFPDTISKSISVQNELTGVIVNGFLTMAALLYMNSQMGMASIFPVEAHRPGSIFNFFRWFFPFITMYLVPFTPIFHDTTGYFEVWIGLGYGLFGLTGKSLQYAFHGVYAISGFFFAPVLELIHLCLSVRRFNDLYQPLLVQDDSWSKFPSGFQNLYKYSWFLFQLMRAVCCVMTLVSLFYFFVRGSNTEDPYWRVKSLGHEMMLGLYLAVNYMFYSLTKLLETGEGKLATLIVVIPALVITLWMFVVTIQEDIKLANVDAEPLVFLGKHVVHMGCNIANFGGNFVQWLPSSETCEYPSDRGAVSPFVAPFDSP